MSVPDIEIGRYALRTFRVDYLRHELQAVTRGPHHWKGGTCVAKCVKPYEMLIPVGPHEPPHKDCTCGIYGTLTLSSLAQFGKYMNELVTVMAAEGKTIIGDVGLRTSAARIVAYWSPIRGIRKICEKQFPGATNFTDLSNMLTYYSLSYGDPWISFVSLPKKPRINPLVSSVLWCIWCLAFVLWDVEIGVEKILVHQYLWAMIEAFNALLMGVLFWLNYRRLRARLG